MNPKIGIIGGSGLYDFEGFVSREERAVATSFGAPSDSYVLGTLAGVEVAFLSRHGRGHLKTPTEVNYRANILGMKLLGVDRIISVSAVGSMRRKVRPGDLVLVDQFIDMTKGRERSFFGEGVVAHVSLAEPICPRMRRHLCDAAAREEIRHHEKGTYVCIEGPQFSTRAESELFRSWEVDVIGMTNLPEARLAREAEIGYATIALATDYDCWNDEAGHVTVDEVVRTLKANVEKAKRVIAKAIPAIVNDPAPCPAWSAMENAIMTDPAKIPQATKEKLGPLVKRYLG